MTDREIIEKHITGQQLILILFDSLESRMDSLESKVAKLEQTVSAIKLHLENITDKNISILAE